MWTPHEFYLLGLPSPMGAARERPEFDIKLPLGAPLLIFPRSNHLKSFPQGDTSARQRRFKIFLLCKLPRAIESHLYVWKLYRWHLSPNKQSSPTTKSLHPVVVTSFLVGFPQEIVQPATGGFVCNCPMQVVCTTEASGSLRVMI